MKLQYRLRRSRLNSHPTPIEESPGPRLPQYPLNLPTARRCQHQKYQGAETVTAPFFTRSMPLGKGASQAEASLISRNEGVT